MTHDQTTAHLIRVCHHIADLSNADLGRASARAGLLLSLHKAQHLLALLETREGSSVLAFLR